MLRNPHTGPIDAAQAGVSPLNMIASNHNGAARLTRTPLPPTRPAPTTDRKSARLTQEPGLTTRGGTPLASPDSNSN